MRNFLAFLALIAVLVGLVVAAAHALGLPPLVTTLALAVGATLVAGRLLLDALARLRQPGPAAAPEQDARRAARQEARRRTRALLARVRAVVRALRRAQEPPRLWYRERGGLPWWIVVGAADHGKTALLRAAPDCVELAPGDPDEPRFFAGRDAVFVELPSDYDLRPEAARAFAALLRAIRRLRPRQPLAGALVVHRADALLRDSGDGAGALKLGRRQLDRVLAALDVQAPVSLVVTHLDQLAGFAECVADLPARERPFGLTLPLRESREALLQAVHERLAGDEGLLAQVRQRCLGLYSRAQPGSDAQARLHGFWQQFADLSARAAAAAAGLLAAPLPGGERLRVRGLYFTSAAPGAAPEDAFLAALAERLGGRLPRDEAAPAPPGPPAFTGDLFAVELARDAQYATRLRRLRVRRGALELGAAGLALGLAALAVLGSTRSVRNNRAHMEDTVASAQAVARVPRGRLSAPGSLARLRDAVTRWRAEEPPAGMGWGLFRGEQLAPPTRESFTGAVCRGVLRPLAERALPPLRQFAARYAGGGVPTPAELAQATALLRRYLLLSSPPAPGEPAPWGMSEQTWLIDHLTAAWKQAEGGGDDDARATLLEDHARWLAGDAGPAASGDTCAQTGDARGAARDAALVADVREVLARTAPEPVLVDRIVDRINRRKDLRALDVRGLTTASHLRGDVQVRPAFTRRGWEAFRGALGEALREDGDDAWVRGQPLARGGRRERCEKLRDLYVERYVRAWQDFIAGLRLASPATLAEAAAIFAELGEQAPLTPVFVAVHEHTQGLPPLPCSDSAGRDWLARLAPAAASPALAASRDAADVGEHFARLVGFAVAAPGPAGKPAAGGKIGLDSYHARLADVRAAIDAAIENAAEMPALQTAVGNAYRDVEELVRRSNLGAWQDRAGSLLMPPLAGLRLLVLDYGSARLNAEWCDRVVRQFERTLAGRYPFAADARFDARLADVGLLFHPRTGEVGKFRDELLGAYVHVSGNDVRARDLGTGAVYHLSPRVLAFLDAAHKLGLLLFPGGDAPGLDMDVTMACETGVHKVELTIDDTQLRYMCSTDRAKTLHWPGKGDPRRALLDAYGANARADQIVRQGEFGLFRLLEHGDPQGRGGQDSFGVGYTLARSELGELRLALRPATVRGGNLFYGFGGGDRFLAPFREPALIAPAHALFSERGYTCGPAEASP